MEIWQKILERLRLNQSLYLMVVVHHQGSTPGRAGFKMIVAEDGYIHGSIGGGIMEYGLVEKARELLHSSDERSFVKRQVHNRNKEDGSGMVCSGEQTVAFVPLNVKHLSVVQGITQAHSANQKIRIILTEEGFQLTQKDENSTKTFESSENTNWQYSENIGFKDALYIVGGGHVSLAVSDLFVSMGYHVTVLDNRENLNTLAMNESAHKKIVIDFEDVAIYIDNKESALVAVMTNRFIDDKIVLSKLMDKNLHYLGVLGSKAKLKLMWDVFKKEGVLDADLSKISGPIGLDIKSQTPIEIAISIAAEIINLRK